MFFFSIMMQSVFSLTHSLWLTRSLSSLICVVFDMRTNDWTNVIQPELEHILNHPSNKYMKIAYFTVTPKTIEFMTMASLVAEIQNQSRKK
jgi:hypothetical protein